MKTALPSVLVCLVLSLLIAAVAAANKPMRLFDGKTFAGWEGNLNLFRIQDGAIVGGTMTARIPRNEFLCTKREYADFILRLKFKAIGEKVNGGIQFRSRRIPNDNEVIGYQADLGEGYYGSLYDESRRRKTLAKPNEAELMKMLRLNDWNEYVIQAEGQRIRLSINGQQTVDYTEADDKIEQTGRICLQIHAGGPSEAWYKDIVIEVPRAK